MGGWVWSAFVAVVLYAGFRELNVIMNGINIRPSQLIVLPVGFLMALFAALNKEEFLPPLLTAAIIASFFRLLFRQPRATIGDIGGTLLCLVYVIYLPLHFILIRQIGVEEGVAPLAQPGLWYVLFVMTVIGASDIGAYYVGKRFGKRLLYPEISPKKTMEGAIGGFLVGMILAISLSGITNLPIHHAVILGILVIVAGQLGDLTESMLKRDAGVKDSSGLLLGHGGFLDRMDSYLFSGAIAYYYIHWVVLKEGLASEIIQFFQGWVL